MDNQEINKRIAEIKGLNPITHESIDPFTGNSFKSVYRTLNGDRIGLPRDYINDPALNRELELELMSNRWWPRLDKEKYFYRRDVWWSPDIGKDKDFGKATALAWLEEFGK